MLSFDRNPDLAVILSIGVGSAANRLKGEARKRGVACLHCGVNVFDFEGGDDFKEAAGCWMCVNCYEEAGLENEHADGGHEEEPVADCPICA